MSERDSASISSAYPTAAPVRDTSKSMALAKLVAQEKARALGAFEVSELAGQEAPERRWLVPNLVPRGAVTMLSCDRGVGKSLLGMQLMTAGAVGGRWIGIEVPRFTSLGFFCEDDRAELPRWRSRPLLVGAR